MSERPRVPDWWLERLAAGELPEREARELLERLERAGEAARLDALEASSAEILRAHPAAEVVAEVERRAAAQGLARPRAGRPLWPVLALGGSAALTLMLVRVLDVQPDAGRAGVEPSAQSAQSDRRVPGEGSAERLIAKGLEPYLSIYRRTGASPERLAARARVRAGDTLQLAYVAAGQRFGVVASVDGRGAVTLHLPETSGRAAALDDRGETALPHAFELDATPGNERFVFVTSSAPFDTGAVVAHLEGSAPRLPAGLSLRSIELEKSTP
jgi:hypothetical protein